MIRKLFFLLVIIFINSSCSMATLDAKSLKEGTEDSEVLGKENAAFRRERNRDMLMAKLERLGKVK
jgi:hypothetical protein